jgi:hypothetical protein
MIINIKKELSRLFALAAMTAGAACSAPRNSPPENPARLPAVSSAFIDSVKITKPERVTSPHVFPHTEGGSVRAPVPVSVFSPVLDLAPQARKFQVMMSENTRSRLGGMAAIIERELPGWAQADVLLLTSEDAVQYEASTDDEHQQWQNDETADAAFSMKELLAKFSFPAADPLYDKQDDYLADMFWNLKNGRPYAYRPDSTHKAVIILMNDPQSQPGSSYASFTAGLPDKMIQSDSISSQSWFLLFLMHEAAHSTQEWRSNGPGAELRALKDETDADYQALIRYAVLPTLNFPYDDRLPEFFQAMRAIGTLRFTEENQGSNWPFRFSHHVSNISLDVASTGNLAVTQQDIKPARMAAAIIHVTDLSQAALASIVKSRFNEHTLDDLNTIMGPFDLDRGLVRNMLTADLAKDDMSAGKAIARDNPLLHYAVVRSLYDRGFFPEGSTERIIAREYIEAYEKYVPQSLTSSAVQSFLQAARNMSDIFSHTDFTPQKIQTLNDGYYNMMRVLSEPFSLPPLLYLRTLPPVLVTPLQPLPKPNP